MDYTEKFCDTIQEFLADLIKVFPNDTDMQVYHVGLKGLCMMCPEKVYGEFYESVVVPYYERIRTKDEEFFMNHDFNDVKEVPDGARILNKTMGYWKSLNPNDKETVWKYLRVLCTLSKKIVEGA